MHPDEEFQNEAQIRRPRGLRVIDGNATAVELPNSPESERRFLGCCLVDEGVTVARARAARLDARAFFTQNHATVWKKLADLHARGKPIETGILAEELRASNELDAIGGYPFLTQLTHEVATTIQAGYFLERIIDLALLRGAIRQSRSTEEICQQHQGEGVEEILGAVALKFQKLADFALRRGREGLKDRVAKRLEDTMQAAAGKVDRSRWLMTGLQWLDACILPFDVKQEDWLVIMAGPPSGGKSSIMRHVALYNCDQGKRGAVFLLETGLRWLDAGAATHARINLRELDRTPRDRLAQFKSRYEQLVSYAEERLWVFEDLVYVEDIERQIREINRRLIEKDLSSGVAPEKARGLDFVVIDYLQIMATRQQFRGHREQVVSHISMTLKRLFKQLDITGFVGAQINRSSREDPAKPPTLAALRESGAIEQDADRVIFLHTPPVNRAGVTQDGSHLIDEVEVIQRKSRNGPRDVSVALLFHKTCTRYEEASRKGDARPGLPKPQTGYKREQGEG